MHDFLEKLVYKHKMQLVLDETSSKSFLLLSVDIIYWNALTNVIT